MKIADELAYFRTLGTAGFTVSEAGALAYHGSGDDLRFGWYDRRGNPTEAGWPMQNSSTVRISPDAQRVAADVVDPRTGTADIWLHDLSGGAPVRLTSDLASEQSPNWSPDGRRIVFSSERLGAPSLLLKTIETGAEEQLVGGPIPLAPEDWSADGRWIAYVSNSRQTGRDLWLLPIAGDRKPRQFSGTRFEEWDARFSPDSAWIAFASNESSKTEVYVASVQRPGEKRAVSIGGGAAPRWKRDGRELYYMAADNQSIMAVPIEPGATFKAGPPARLFSLGTQAIARGRARATPYDVSPDGQRFLIGVPVGEQSSSLITVVLNWATGLKP
jgi:WD40 repeat protein